MRYFVDDNGVYLGGSDGEPLSANEVLYPPNDARQLWSGSSYGSVILTNAEFNAIVDAEMIANDITSIRILLEWAATMPTASQLLKDKKADQDALRLTRKI